MDKYLLHILHEVNTIIIPGLGALTVTNKATGEIMFMSYLKHDDGNLVKHICEKENFAENDAKNLIAKYVREIHAQLDKGESYDMYQFGRFIKKDGEVDFESWNSYQHNPEDTYIAEELPATENIIEVVEPSIEIIDKPVEETAKIADTIEEVKEDTPLENANEAIEELLAASKPIETSKSIDEILNTEGSNTSTEENPIPQEEEIQAEIQEKEAVVPEEKVELPSKETEKPEEVIEIDTTHIKPSENVFIPKEELAEIAETQQKEKEKPKVVAKSKVAPKKAIPEKSETPKKKNKLVLIIVLAVVVLGGTAVVVFYDKISNTIFADKEVKSDSKTEKLNDENLEEIEKQVALEQESTEGAETKETEQETKVEPIVENTKAVETSKAVDSNLSYHLIAGSFGVEENANRLAKKYSDSGKNASVLGKFDNMYLVSYESFATKEEANSALKNSEVKGWIFKYPK